MIYTYSSSKYPFPLLESPQGKVILIAAYLFSCRSGSYKEIVTILAEGPQELPEICKKLKKAVEE